MENNAPKKESTREKIGDGILAAVVEILLVVIVLRLAAVWRLFSASWAS